MGYETYLVEILINRENYDNFVKELIARKFLRTEANQSIYLEKTYSMGIIEIRVTQTKVAFRYAKPNLKESLLEFLKELQELAPKYGIKLYDIQKKKYYDKEDFLEIVNSFEKSHNEFVSNFPMHDFPIKSEDVFKNKT